MYETTRSSAQKTAASAGQSSVIATENLTQLNLTRAATHQVQYKSNKYTTV